MTDRDEFIALTETIARGLQRTLDTVWERPDAAAVAEGFLRGEVKFVISREVFEATWVDPPAGEPAPDGFYV